MSETTMAHIGFTADSSAITRTNRELRTLANRGNTADRSNDSLTRSFGRLAAGAGAAFTVLKSFSKVVDISRQFDVLDAKLQTATGSAERSAEAFKAVQEFAAKTPFDLAQATNGFTQLVNLGLTPSEKAMVSYGNTASAMGKDLSQMIEAVADATVGEFERLKTFGIKSKTVGENVSFTFRGMTTTVKKEAAAIEGYLMALGTNEFAGAMALRAATLDGALSNLGDTWDNLFLTVSKQGIGSLIQDGVIMAGNALQVLTDWIETGALAEAISGIGEKFSGWEADVSNAVNLVSIIIGESTNGWGESVSIFFDNMLKGFKQLPEMTRFAIQATTVQFASMSAQVGIQNDAMFDHIGLRFERLVGIAKLDGKKIANAMNPFSESMDLGAEVAKLDAEIDALHDGVTSRAKTATELLQSTANESIQLYALEGLAATDNYNLRIEASKKLVDQLKIERDTPSTIDRLAKFKIIPDKESGTQDASPAFQKQVEALALLQTQIGLTADEMEIFGAVQKSVARGDTPEQTAAIKEQTRAFLDQSNAMKDATGYQDWIEGITGDSTKGKLEAIEQEMLDVWLAMDEGGEGGLSNEAGLEYLDKLEQKAKDLQDTMSGKGMFEGVIGGAKDALGAVQKMTKSGSDDFKKLGVAIQAASLIQSVFAVLNQAGGDPYSAFGRMAAMASSVASLGFSVGGLSGGFSDTAAQNQETQSTNVWGEKSESIANSIEMTAHATSELVGINRGMLRALNNLNSGISGVSSMTNRKGKSGLSDLELKDLGIEENFLDFFAGGAGKIFGALDPLTKLIGKWLGGESKTTNSGLRFSGDLQGNADVDAFQTTEYKKWKFGDTKRRKDYQDLGEEIDNQVGMVFLDIADAVSEGATALGLSSDLIEHRINASKLNDFELSLKDLSAADKEKEIEAYFSSVFDGVSANVVPFLKEFQNTGESLGETLARVSTQVQITELLSDRLGITLGDKMANPELFAKIANNLADMVGGLEDFASKTSSFIDNFAPDSVKFSIASDALRDSLESVGLAVPESSKGFFELMQTLDGSTVAGQEQIAMLLNNQDIAKDYYKLLEKMNGDTLRDAKNSEKDLLSFNKTMQALSNSMLNFVDGLFQPDNQKSNQSVEDAIADASAGDFSTAKNLDLNSLSFDSGSATNKGIQEFEKAKLAKKIQNLAILVGETKTPAELALTESKEQTKQLSDLNDKYDTMVILSTAVRTATIKTADELTKITLDSLPVRIVE